MKKNQLDLFNNLPQGNVSGLSDKYKELSEGAPARNWGEFASSGEMNPDEYIHALTESLLSHPNAWRARRAILDSSQHNTPENNDKVLNVLKEKALSGDEDSQEMLKQLNERGAHSRAMLEEAAKGKDSIFALGSHPDEAEAKIAYNLANNDKIQDKEHKILYEQNPSILTKGFSSLSDDLKRKLINNPKTLENVDHRDIRAFVNDEMLNPNPDAEPKFGAAEARSILNHPTKHDALYEQDSFDHVLGKLPEIERNAYAAKHLGIEGGEKVNKDAGDINPFAQRGDMSDEEFNDRHNWDNWNHGEGYNKDIAKRLAASKHLSDEHAEHIKRHGNIDEKYELYNNNHVDPRHGVEMFQKWNQGHTEHGYDPEQLGNKFKKHKSDVFTMDDLPEDYWDEHEDDMREHGDEWANENYSMDEWARDNRIKPWAHKDPSDHNDGEEWVRDYLHNNYDWEDENPNHNPLLEKMHQAILDNAPDEAGWVKQEDAIKAAQDEWEKASVWEKEATPKPTDLSHLNLPGASSDGTIHQDDIEEASQTENPEKIDYQNHDDYTIDDHSDYNDRYNEAVNEWRDHMDSNHGFPDDFWDEHSDDYYNSEGYNQSRAEGEKDFKEQHFQDEILPDLYGQSHQDDRFIPEHLRQHIPEYQQLKENREKRIGDGANTSFLDKHIKERSREHEYGDDQHFYEMVKDHAQANGGTIDIGTMHKLFPNQKEKWKKVFENKGKLSVPEVDEKIAALPKTKYGISFGKWDSHKMQNINGRDEAIIRLDHSDESLAPIQQDPEVFSTFKKVMETSKRSGHPTKDNTIAWARVDMTDPKHWMVDELQSDFGKTVTQYLKQQGHHDKASHIDTIANHHKNWREAMLNYITKEAKKHGVEKISTHSPESKAAHTGAGKTHTVYNDSYGKVPRSMGFKPVPGSELPLTEKGRNQIATGDKQAGRNTEHEIGMDFHSGAHIAHLQLAKELGSNPTAQEHEKFAQHHLNMFRQHADMLRQIDPSHSYHEMSPQNIVDNLNSDLSEHKASANQAILSGKPDSSEKDVLLNKPIAEETHHPGHTLNLTPSLIKHFIDVADALIKAEIIYINTLAKNEQSDKLLDKIRILRKYIGYED